MGLECEEQLNTKQVECSVSERGLFWVHQFRSSNLVIKVQWQWCLLLQWDKQRRAATAQRSHSAPNLIQPEIVDAFQRIKLTGFIHKRILFQT